MKGIKMEERINENATTNKINPQADTLTDLPVAAEQSEETNGGARNAFSSASINVLLGDGSARSVS